MKIIACFIDNRTFFDNKNYFLSRMLGDSKFVTSKELDYAETESPSYRR